MSKYDGLWRHICEQGETELTLSFAEIERAGGVPLDHSFLSYKKELAAFGWQVGRISMKNQTVDFKKI